MFFIIVSNVIASGGLGGALVRLTHVTDDDYSTVLVYNVFVSFIFFILIFSFSGFIAEFYNDRSLRLPLRVLSFIILINAFHIVNLTKLVKELNFKLKTIIQVLSMSISSILAIALAAFNLGIWSLVAMQISISVCTLILLWYYLGIFIRFKFVQESFNKVFNFGMNTTLASVLNTAFNEIYSVLIAKIFSLDQAGYFYQARKLQSISISVFNSLTQGPLYATLAKFSNDKSILISYYKKITQIFLFFVGLIIIILYCNADFIITAIYGEKWFESIYYFRLLLLASLFIIQIYFIRILFKLEDKTKFILRVEIFTKLLQVISIVFGIIYNSAEWLLYGLIGSSAIGVFISVYVIQFYTDMKSAINLRYIIYHFSIIFFINLSYLQFSSFFEKNTLFSILYTFVGLILYVFLSYVLKLFKIQDINFGLKLLKNKKVSKS